MKAAANEWMVYKLAEEMGLPSLFHLEIFCGIKETEKAVYAMFYTGYNASGTSAHRRCHWIPKRAIENIDSLPIIPDYDEATKKFYIEYSM